jgi:glutamyl-tRNA reductase
MVERNSQPLLLIDLAVPRDLDPEIRNVDGCRLLDLDDLNAVVSESLTSRRREAAKVETIVAEAIADYRRLERARAANPAIAALRRHADEIRTAALAKAASRLSGLTPEQRAAVEMLTAQLVSQLIHPTISYLKASCLSLAPPAGADQRHPFEGAPSTPRRQSR